MELIHWYINVWLIKHGDLYTIRYFFYLDQDVTNV
jgi:hypothetical protein